MSMSPQYNTSGNFLAMKALSVIAGALPPPQIPKAFGSDGSVRKFILFSVTTIHSPDQSSCRALPTGTEISSANKSQAVLQRYIKNAKAYERFIEPQSVAFVK